MQATIKKWGNSLGVRIPKTFSTEAGIKENSIVEINISEGRIVMEPVKEEKSLAELLSEVTEDNIHDEIPHDVKGSEAW